MNCKERRRTNGHCRNTGGHLAMDPYREAERAIGQGHFNFHALGKLI
jgi:hypothetical protein